MLSTIAETSDCSHSQKFDKAPVAAAATPTSESVQRAAAISQCVRESGRSCANEAAATARSLRSLEDASPRKAAYPNSGQVLPSLARCLTDSDSLAVRPGITSYIISQFLDDDHQMHLKLLVRCPSARRTQQEPGLGQHPPQVPPIHVEGRTHLDQGDPGGVELPSSSHSIWTQ